MSYNVREPMAGQPTDYRILTSKRRNELNLDSSQTFGWFFIFQPFISMFRAGEWALVLLFFSLYVGIVHLAIRYGRRRAALNHARLAVELLSEYEAKHAVDLADAIPVCLLPPKADSVFATNPAWDAGYLRIDGGLRYYGDAAELRIARSEIHQVRVEGYHRPSLVIKFGGSRVITIRLFDGSTPVEQYAKLQGIRARIALMPDLPALAQPA